jgi:hypothetical protein
LERLEMCNDEEGWRVTGRVTLELEALMGIDEKPDEEHVINTLRSGYWGTKTTEVVGYEVTGIHRACDECEE